MSPISKTESAVGRLSMGLLNWVRVSFFCLLVWSLILYDARLQCVVPFDMYNTKTSRLGGR